MLWRHVSRLGAAVAFALSVSCATYSSGLARAQRAFEQGEHERALAIFRGLEPDLDELTPAERARYAYLRGMTDYRVGYRADARHWLAFASAAEAQSPGSISTEWAKRLATALGELNESVYTAGTASLSDPPSTDVGQAGPTGNEPAADGAADPAPGGN